MSHGMAQGSYRMPHGMALLGATWDDTWDILVAIYKAVTWITGMTHG